MGKEKEKLKNYLLLQFTDFLICYCHELLVLRKHSFHFVLVGKLATPNLDKTNATQN